MPCGAAFVYDSSQTSRPASVAETKESGASSADEFEADVEVEEKSKLRGLPLQIQKAERKLEVAELKNSAKNQWENKQRLRTHTQLTESTTSLARKLGRALGSEAAKAMADKLLKFVDLIERRRALFDKIRSKPESLIRETIGEKDFSILEKLPPQLLGSIMQTAALQLTASTETADLAIRVVSLAAAAGFWKTLHVGLIGAAELSREANDLQRSCQHEITLVFADFDWRVRGL